MKRKFAIASAILIILGFGLIHGSMRYAEYIGPGLIGIGTSYLIYLLYSSKQSKNNYKK